MSASASKQTSRWGSFLQQAVAGVESRLDNMLAEGIEEQNTPKPPVAPTPAVKAVKTESGVLESPEPAKAQLAYMDHRYFADCVDKQ